MIFQKTAFSDILGMNARNLLYITRFNSQANKRFADDKIFTKRFLQSRGLGTAKMYRVLTHASDISKDYFDTLPQSFVIKPNKGFAGGGILPIVRKKNNHWYTPSGTKIDKEHLYLQCVDILEGKYSISGTRDSVIFEELLIPHSDLNLLTKEGLSDVRVIVFNMVPIMAMLRIPTAQSEGKGNLELGAIGMGIDMGSGIGTGAVQNSNFFNRLPNGEDVRNFKVPFWDEILIAASQIQQVTSIGYLGVDLVLTENGVKVLEVNARAGLKIQLANRTPLKKRLDKVTDIKILTPEEGAEVSKKLFSKKINYEPTYKTKPILGIQEEVRLNTEPPQDLIAHIDLSAEHNFINQKWLDKDEKILDITLLKQRLKLPVKVVKEIPKHQGDIIIAGKFLSDFYIDPSKTTSQDTNSKQNTTNIDDKVLQNIDNKICEIDQQIKLLSNINPKNITEQKELFLSNPEFSPRFYYKDISIDIGLLRNDLKKLPEIDHPLYPLYQSKIKEIDLKLSLIESRGSSEFSSYSEKIFGKATLNSYKRALDYIKTNSPFDEDTSEIMDTKKSIEHFQSFLDDHKLNHWKIKIIEDSVSDIQVTKRDSILIKDKATFSYNRIQALIVHEIGTHVFRYENAKKQPLKILERGTAGYLKTEEGLAIYNQNLLNLNLGFKKLNPAYQVIALYMAQKMSFEDLFHYLTNTFSITEENAWKLCLKSKRGFTDTRGKGAFTKDIIYFLGLEGLQTFLKKGGDIKELYIGKIGIEDLPLVKKIKGLQEPKFLL